MTKKSVPSVPDKKNGNIEHSSSLSKASDSKNAVYIYDFVINNYDENQVCQLKSILPSICKKARFGKEVGESGTPHLQGYISLIKKERMTGLVKMDIFKGASFRPCRNEEALIEYCGKGEDVWSYGLPVPIRIIKNLYPWQKEIEDLYFTEPHDTNIYWFWESKGNVGKSSFCKYMFVKHKAMVVRGGKLADIMNIVFNTNMDICRMMIFDLPRGTGGNISYTSLEAIKDGLITNTKYETGAKAFNPPHVVVFANFPPERTDRISDHKWIITEITK